MFQMLKNVSSLNHFLSLIIDIYMDCAILYIKKASQNDSVVEYGHSCMEPVVMYIIGLIKKICGAINFSEYHNTCCFLLLMKFMSITRHKVPLVYFKLTNSFHNFSRVSNSNIRSTQHTQSN